MGDINVVDWGIFGKLATRANGHLGFGVGVFVASQRS
jgi:hypothetical protein